MRARRLSVLDEYVEDGEAAVPLDQSLVSPPFDQRIRRDLSQLQFAVPKH